MKENFIPGDAAFPYPRVCAHRGLCGAAPENSLPAYFAAVEQGADEIEFDLWETRDGEIVSAHDSLLERVSDGEGRIWDHSLKELKRLDFGAKFSPAFAGLRIPALEEILAAFSRRVVMNVHVKGSEKSRRISENGLKKIVSLLSEYRCENHAYFMTGDEETLLALRRLAPEIPRCCGTAPSLKTILSRAEKYDCGKIQLFQSKTMEKDAAFSPELIRRAKEKGLIVNVCPVETKEKALALLRRGADTLLTDRFSLVYPAVHPSKKP